MKKTFLLLCLVLGITFCYGAFTETAKTSPQSAQQIEAEKFTHTTAEEYGRMRGKKLNFFERIAFRSAKAKVRHELKNSEDGHYGFNGLGFVIGVFFSLLGIIAVSILSTDRNLRKWTWIGAGVGILLSLLFLL